jgi:hypothetical protein
VSKAIVEFEQLGRDQFLYKYGYGKSTRYMLKHDEQLYDSKAILGVAHGIQFPDEGPLEASHLHGGPQTISKLRDLGFPVVDIESGLEV